MELLRLFALARVAYLHWSLRSNIGDAHIIYFIIDETKSNLLLQNGLKKHGAFYSTM